MVSRNGNEGKGGKAVVVAMEQHANDNIKMKDSMNAESVPNTSLKTTGHSSQDTINEHSKMSTSNNGNIKSSQGTDTTMMMKDSMQQPSTIELVVGGLYHFWNGATMAAVYTLVLGKGKWYYGLVSIMALAILYSLHHCWHILHMGAIIGISAQRFVKERHTLINSVRSREAILPE